MNERLFKPAVLLLLFVASHAKSLDNDREIDLLIARINGTNARLLVRNGFSPSWR